MKGILRTARSQKLTLVPPPQMGDFHLAASVALFLQMSPRRDVQSEAMRHKTRHAFTFRRAEIDALKRGPADERMDVTQSAVVPLASELFKMEQYQQMYDRMAKAEATKPRRGVAMSQIDIAGDMNTGLRLIRPVGLDFPQLRHIVRSTPILSIIINRRVRQVQRFLTQPQFDYQPGFKLRFKDPDRKVTDDDKARFAWIRSYLMHCGAEFDPRKRRALQRDNLHEFTQKHLRDSLTMDAAPVEFVNTRTGRVHGFTAVDGAKVFLSDPNQGLTDDFDGPAEFNVLTGRTSFGDPSNIVAVYAQEGRVRAQYTHMDLLYPIRNKTAEEEMFGYGIAEPETILHVCTAMLNAFALNSRSISDNSYPRGILSLLGDYQQEDVDRFKDMMLAEMTGVQNRWRMPVFTAEAQQGAGVAFTPIGASVEDAMYSRWWTLMTAIACSTYQMDPSEIAFESFTAGGASTLSGSDTEAKLINSVDSGLHTLLTWYGSTLGEIVELIDPEVEFYWTGLEDTKEDDQAREQGNMLFGETRERHGLSNEGIPEEVLKAPNSVAGQAYMTVLQQKQQEQMQAQQAAQQGQPGDDQEQPEQDPQEEQESTTPEDPEHPSGPQGEPRFQDHQGNVWQGQKQGEPDEPKLE